MPKNRLTDSIHSVGITLAAALLVGGFVWWQQTEKHTTALDARVKQLESQVYDTFGQNRQRTTAAFKAIDKRLRQLEIESAYKDGFQAGQDHIETK